MRKIDYVVPKMAFSHKGRYCIEINLVGETDTIKHYTNDAQLYDDCRLTKEDNFECELAMFDNFEERDTYLLSLL